MTDFPHDSVRPTHISTYMDLAGGEALRNQANAGTPASGSWAQANLAVFVPLLLPWPYVVRRMFWTNGATVAGNSDIGIYSTGGTRLWSAGSTANAGASAIQYVTVSGGVRLDPGRYYLAFANDGTTGRVMGPSNTIGQAARLCGLLQMASALPLPATATFAAMGSVVGQMPLMGLTNTPSGF